MNPEDLAHALWYMFATGAEANRYDEKVAGRYLVKATRIIELADRNRISREADEARP